MQEEQKNISLDDSLDLDCSILSISYRSKSWQAMRKKNEGNEERIRQCAMQRLDAFTKKNPSTLGSSFLKHAEAYKIMQARSQPPKA